MESSTNNATYQDIFAAEADRLGMSAAAAQAAIEVILKGASSEGRDAAADARDIFEISTVGTKDALIDACRDDSAICGKDLSDAEIWDYIGEAYDRADLYSGTYLIVRVEA